MLRSTPHRAPHRAAALVLAATAAVTAGAPWLGGCAATPPPFPVEDLQLGMSIEDLQALLADYRAEGGVVKFYEIDRENRGWSSAYVLQSAGLWGATVVYFDEDDTLGEVRRRADPGPDETIDREGFVPTY